MFHKRILALALTLSVCLAGVTGCSSEEDKPKNPKVRKSAPGGQLKPMTPNAGGANSAQ